jgi:hypothetical protein
MHRWAPQHTYAQKYAPAKQACLEALQLDQNNVKGGLTGCLATASTSDA